MDEPMHLEALCNAAPLNEFDCPFARINELEAWASRFTSYRRWEINRSDKLVIGVKGRLQFTLRLPAGEKVVVVEPGQVFKVPANTWHSPVALGDQPSHAVALCDYTGTRTQDEAPPVGDTGRRQ